MAVVLLAGGLGYGAYCGAAVLWHRRGVEQAIPVALDGLRHQRDELIGAIEAYKSQLGFYPPLCTKPGRDRGAINPLCYELVGARYDEKGGGFRIVLTKDPLSVEEIGKYFNMRAFSNCLAFPSMPTNFLANVRLSYGPLSKENEAYGVGVNYTEMISEPFWEDFEFTTWRYAATPALHNPGKFDVWVEMAVAGRHFVIGNWPEVK